LTGIGLFPKTAKVIWHEAIKPSRNVISVILAGVMLGLVTAIRPLGPAAGALVAFYFLLRAGWRSLPTLAVYLVIALAVALLAWPSLWDSPVRNFIWSLSESSDFPWGGKVLFNGIDLELDQIPRAYMPTLMTLQFTETSLALFLTGLVVGVVRSFKRSFDWKTMLVLSTWAFLPLLAVIALRPTLYDNFRHFFFIIPPLFLIAGIGFQAILDRLRSPLWKTLVVSLAILPGVYGLITLHPYQYVYYNSLAGGLQGAFRRYEMDYWATSYREATEFLNNTAPNRARVIVWGPEQVVRKFARKDLVIREYVPEKSGGNEKADYAIISTRYDKDLYLFPEGETILEIGRGGALLAVVKQLHEISAPE
jgi:MFS family permease